MSEPNFLHSWRKHFVDLRKQSLYWNYATGNYLDITFLSKKGLQFSEEWTKALQHEPTVNFEFEPTASSKKIVADFYNEGKNIEYRQGGKSLGFGYPIVSLVSETKETPIEAPLFIWQVALDPAYVKPGTWLLRHLPNHDFQLNPVVLEYFKHEDKEDIVTLLEKCNKYGFFSAKDCLSTISELCLKMDWPTTNSSYKVDRLPNDTIFIDLQEEKGGIVWGGILGVFDSSYQFQIQRLSKYLDHGLPDIQAPQSRDFLLSFMDTDPAQTTIIDKLDQYPNLCVQGVPGSGKTFSAAAVLANALANEKKCLVVAPTLSKLKEIKQYLDKLGLGELCAILSGGISNRDTFLATLNVMASGTKKEFPIGLEQLKIDLEQADQSIQKFETQHTLLTRTIFGPYSWTEMVGRYLENQRIEGKELLGNILNPKDFLFAFPEYAQLLKTIIEAEPLFSKVNTLKHPLSILEDDIFRAENIHEARTIIEEDGKHYLSRANRLVHDHLKLLQQYNEKLTQHYENHYHKNKEDVNHLKLEIRKAVAEFGPDFEKGGFLSNSKLSLLKSFSKSQKAQWTAKENIFQLFQTLVNRFNEERCFNYIFSSITKGNIGEISKNLLDFENSLEEWYDRVPILVKEDTLQVSSQTVNFGVSDFKNAIQDLHEKGKHFVDDLNTAQLFTKKYILNIEKFTSRKTYIEKVRDEIEAILYQLRDFDIFYPWQHFWLQLEPNSKQVVEAFVRSRPENWEAAFNSWYFFGTLQTEFDQDIPNSHLEALTFGEKQNSLRERTLEKTIAYWKNRMLGAAAHLKNVNRPLHKKIFEKVQGTSHESKLYTLLAEEMDFFTSFFPALFVTAAQANELFIEGDGKFDLLIMDDAHQISEPTGALALWMGKSRILYGLPEAISENESSIFSFSENDDFKVLKLGFKHSDNNMQRFISSSFGIKTQANSLPVVDKHFDFKLYQSNGTFDVKQEINQKEIDQVVKILSELMPLPTRVYPSVGIFCFSKAQRNELLNRLRQIRSERAAGAEKLRMMEQSGLQVLSPEDFSSQHFELVIISSVFSKKEAEGNQQWEMIKGESGRVHMLNILGNAKQRLCFVTSLSSKFLEQNLFRKEEEPITGLQILSWLYFYSEAIEQGDETEQKEVLKFAKRQDAQTRFKREKHQSFERRVQEGLLPFLEEGRLSINQQIDGVEIDLMIKAKNPENQPILIICDGFNRKDVYGGGYYRSLQLDEYFRAKKYELIYIWSVNWWKSPDTEVRKLASQIIKIDQNTIEV